jgi:hypothetical protein
MNLVGDSISICQGIEEELGGDWWRDCSPPDVVGTVSASRADKPSLSWSWQSAMAMVAAARESGSTPAGGSSTASEAPGQSILLTLSAEY